MDVHRQWWAVDDLMKGCLPVVAWTALGVVNNDAGLAGWYWWWPQSWWSLLSSSTPGVEGPWGGLSIPGVGIVLAIVGNGKSRCPPQGSEMAAGAVDDISGEIYVVVGHT